MLCIGKYTLSLRLTSTVINSNHHRGESGIGTWTVIVKDTKINEFNGTWIDWHLKLWGESIDASKATPLPLPTEEDDDNHDEIATTTIPPSVVTPPPSVVSPPTDGSPAGNPTDHPDRPTKPSDTVSADPAELETSPSTSATAVPGSSWLPGFLPTFGVGPRAQAWIYASLALILVFCAGLGVYLFMARRKRLRNSPRDTYEFELLDEEEAEGLTAGVEKDGTSGGKKRTRGGELYDAFAGGSDEEDEFYRDNVEGGSSGSGSDGARREKRALAGDEDEQHVLGSDSEDEGDEREGLRAGRR